MGKSQAVIDTGGRNINNLRYAYDTSLMAESKEELRSLFIGRTGAEIEIPILWTLEAAEFCAKCGGN